MADERCERTEPLATQCGCPQHRGGQTPQEEADAERLQLRARLLTLPVGAGWFPAQHPGTCCECSNEFKPGTAIRRCPVSPRDSGRYVAECCAEETRPLCPDCRTSHRFGPCAGPQRLRSGRYA